VLGRYVLSPGYTHRNFVPSEFQEVVNRVADRIRALRAKNPEIEGLAACGQSGTMLMGALSFVLGMPQIAVRKSSHDMGHDDAMANGDFGIQGYVIVDDFVSSGHTVEHIIREISKRAAPIGKAPKCFGVVAYAGSSYYKCFFKPCFREAPPREDEHLVQVLAVYRDCTEEMDANSLEMANEELAKAMAGIEARQRQDQEAETATVSYSMKFTMAQVKPLPEPCPARMLSMEEVAESFKLMASADTIFKVTPPSLDYLLEFKLPGYEQILRLNPDTS
jgi:hypothetical protein